jgi:lipooligosaccharide transport system permease protein
VIPAVRALHIVQRNALVYRHTWRGSLFTGFLQPTLFLLAMGLGVGTLVDRGPMTLPGGIGFLPFLAPGLLAGMCMQTAAFESSWSILGKITWQRNYEAILATPVRSIDIVAGELGWIAIRLGMVATAFLMAMMAFGAMLSPLAPLAILTATLTGLAFAAPIMAYAGTIKNGNEFNVVFRFIITPLFLFSGIFFPVSRLPEPLQALAAITPLFHGVALTRGVTLGTLESPGWIVHVAYLTAMVAGGAAVAVRTLERRLLP